MQQQTGVTEHHFGSGPIAAAVKRRGAELCSLTDGGGTQLLWQAGPEWPRHAPILFPIVGRLRHDKLVHCGTTYPMKQHGFARDSDFTFVDRHATGCTLALSDSAASRRQYPFPFRLEIRYAARGNALTTDISIFNTGRKNLPASFGLHPAFNWPLAAGVAKDDHAVGFSSAERFGVRRLRNGLLRTQTEPSPIKGQMLALTEALFRTDALVWTRLESRAVTYGAQDGTAIRMSWTGLPHLGLWSKSAGAPFLCIEPWHGFATPVNHDGDFATKPGVMLIAPGKRRSLSCRIEVVTRSSQDFRAAESGSRTPP